MALTMPKLPGKFCVRGLGTNDEKNEPTAEPAEESPLPTALTAALVAFVATAIPLPASRSPAPAVPTTGSATASVARWARYASVLPGGSKQPSFAVPSAEASWAIAPCMSPTVRVPKPPR